MSDVIRKKGVFMPSARDRVIFALFVVSGFCGLCYQVVWVRLAYASFGVITPVISVIISVFMLGLSLGSWAGGRWIGDLCRKSSQSAIFFYAVAEVSIGIGAFVVPMLFGRGETALLSMGQMNSLRYLLASGAIITVAILPWCVFMGFTFPFMMAFIRETDPENTTGFSYLYFANVIGAMGGALITALVLIELFGFKHTLMIAAVLNFAVAAAAVFWGLNTPSHLPPRNLSEKNQHRSAGTVNLPPGEAAWICSVLFATGFICMAMEIVWIRAFTPILHTRTYSFAGLLTVYLLATWIGSYLYRRHLNRGQQISTPKLLSCISVFSLLPIVMNDPRLGIGIPTVLFSIFPFCVGLGYLTPKLIDRFSTGSPYGAGKAYAINVLGCILGPLCASYLFLPWLGVKASLMMLSAPFLVAVLIRYGRIVLKADWGLILVLLALFFFYRSGFVNVSYEEVFAGYQGSQVRRDHTATVVSVGQGFQKRLLVNGIGITQLTPITKLMAHMPLAFLREPPESALVICMGMGTTYRSLLSWNIEAVAVELVPSVAEAFGFYFDDADEIRTNEKGRIVIDDGRRFLQRTNRKFDVITIDPPPPVEAAGSSLLYSEGFYDLAKKHLKPAGIMQQWFPYGELKILNAVTRSLHNSFRYIKAYNSVEKWGVHFLASQTPIDEITAEQFVARMPELARQDMMEWYRDKDAVKLVQMLLQRQVPLSELLHPDPFIKITDDRAYNEYYILRRLRDRIQGTYETTGGLYRKIDERFAGSP